MTQDVETGVRDRPAADAEITPEMIAAGAAVLWACDDIDTA